jgi:hypothetical protein
MATPRSDVARNAQTVQRVWHDEWVVTFEPDRVSSTASGGADVSSGFPAASPLVIAGADGSDLVAASASRFEVVVAGVLTNASELDADLRQATARGS